MIGIPDLFRKIFSLYFQNFPKIAATIVIPLALAVAGFFLPDTRGDDTWPLFAVSVFFACVFFARAWADQMYLRIFSTSSNGDEVNFSSLARKSLVFLPGYAVLVFLWWIFVGFGFAFLLVPGVIFLVWYFFAAPAFVVEGKGILDSFRRSRELTHGFGMAIFGRFFIAILALFFLLILTNQTVAFLLVSAPASASVALSVRAVQLLADQLLAPLFAALIIVLYNDVCRIKST